MCLNSQLLNWTYLFTMFRPPHPIPSIFHQQMMQGLPYFEVVSTMVICFTSLIIWNNISTEKNPYIISYGLVNVNFKVSK